MANLMRWWLGPPGLDKLETQPEAGCFTTSEGHKIAEQPGNDQSWGMTTLGPKCLFAHSVPILKITWRAIVTGSFQMAQQSTTTSLVQAQQTATASALSKGIRISLDQA